MSKANEAFNGFSKSIPQPKHTHTVNHYEDTYAAGGHIAHQKDAAKKRGSHQAHFEYVKEINNGKVL